MSLKPLIKNQTIIIDDHKRGTREIKNWDSKWEDVHIDEKTHHKIDGQKHWVSIKIPINTDQPISASYKNPRKQNIQIPRQLNKEIKNAFNNSATRAAFIEDLLVVLENFDSTLSSLEKVRDTMKRITKHFDLDWTDQDIRKYINNYLVEYTQLCKDSEGIEYIMTIDKYKIRLGSAKEFDRLKFGRNLWPS